MKYGFIYETENLLTGMKYIGRHRRSQDPEDPDDSWYLGSGKHFTNAVNKYGFKNFRRVILCDCDNEEDLNNKEVYYLELVDAANNPIYYNACNSSYRGGLKGLHHTEETKRKIGLHSGASRKGMKLSESHKNKISQSLRGAGSGPVKGSITLHKDDREKIVPPESLEEYLSLGWSKGRLPNNRITNPEFSQYWRGKSQSLESIQKRAESLSGRITITKKGIIKRINPEELPKYLSEGWIQGMPESFSEMRSKDILGKVHIYKGDNQKFIYPGELDEYLSDGWVKGLPVSQREKLSLSKLGESNPAKREDVREKISKANSGRIWVQNGKENVYIYPQELEKYIELGYVRGKKIKPLADKF